MSIQKSGHQLADIILNSAETCNNEEVVAYCREAYSSLLSDVSTRSQHTYLPKVKLLKGIAREEQDRDFSMGRVGELGIFAKYMQAIQSGSVDVFKEEVVEKLSNNTKEYATRSHGDKGHSIFTVTATFGTPEHWKKLSAGYRSVPYSKKVKSIFPEDILNGNKVSTICSPLQAAIMAYNRPMVEFFLRRLNHVN
ncbi:MAG: hypothetical protein ACTJLM_05215 [Ehrlichia sp.]